MQVNVKENREQRNQHNSATQAGQGAQKPRDQRTGPDQESEFEDVQLNSVP